jgi:nicotinate phosphoribosyltransferase
VVAGTGRLLEALQEFRFGPDELAFLRDNHVVDEGALSYLESYRFRGDIWGYGEGDCYFPGSPILVVEAPFSEAVVLETLVLSILNHDTAIASAASRMVNAADERPIIEMGGRRTHEMAAVASARAAYVGGFSSTSNLEAGRDYGIPTSGTSAHAFSLVHDSERDAFAAQLAALGKGTTLLVDTFDVGRAVRTAVERAGPGRGPHRQRRPPDGGPAGPRPAGRAGRAGDQDRAQRRPQRVLDRGAGRRPGRRVRGRDLPGHRVRGAHRGAGLQARGPGQGRRR